MDLRHLRYFIAVADTGGFSKAAARLHISQPALWRQVRELERELGVRLFDRIGRRVQLTGQGEDLLARGRDLLARAESLGERARALGGGERGVLRVGGTPMTLESVLADFLTRWTRSHPDVEVRLTEDSGSRLLTRLEHGDIQLALTVADDGRMRSRPLFPMRVLAVMATAHRLARRRALDVVDLAEETLLLLRSDFISRGWFDAACQVAHVKPRVLLESGAPHTLIALARAGHGMAILPSSVRVARPGVRLAPIVHAGTSLGGWMSINWDPRRFLPLYAERFIEDLAAYTSRRHPGQQFQHAPPVLRPRGHLDGTRG